MDKFEQWFINQDFYTNMRFIHGDALFIKDGDVYRVLPVQMTWVAWQSRQAEVDEKDKRIEDLEFYVRQFLDVLASTHASHKEFLPKLLSHLNHLVNPKDESGEILRGERE